MAGAKDSILLAGFPASGKSMRLRRIHKKGRYAGHKKCFYDQVPDHFLYHNREFGPQVPAEPFLLHWSFWTNSRLAKHALAMQRVVPRIAEVQLLVCTYEEFTRRCERRQLKGIGHGVDTLQATIATYKEFERICRGYRLSVRIVDTSEEKVPGEFSLEQIIMRVCSTEGIPQNA